jgi:hypothetical protein
VAEQVALDQGAGDAVGLGGGEAGLLQQGAGVVPQGVGAVEGRRGGRGEDMEDADVSFIPPFCVTPA